MSDFDQPSRRSIRLSHSCFPNAVVGSRKDPGRGIVIVKGERVLDTERFHGSEGQGDGASIKNRRALWPLPFYQRALSHPPFSPSRQ